MTEDDVLALLERLLDPGPVRAVHEITAGLAATTDVGPALRRLAEI